MAVVSRSTRPIMTEKAPARALRARPEGDSCDPEPVGQPLGELWLPRGRFSSGGSSPRRVADALGDLQRAVSGRLDLDPTTAERGFVVLAPVFSSPLLLPGIVRIPTKEAPKIDLKVRPVRRWGASLGLVDAAALAEGDVDLVVAALLADLPGLCGESLYAERFVCLVREEHPEVGGSLDLETSGRSSTAS